MSAVGYLKERLASRSFAVPFALMTGLCLVDALILGSGRVYLGQDAMFGYGVLLTVYVLAILEIFGLSLVTGMVRSFLKRVRSTRVAH